MHNFMLIYLMNFLFEPVYIPETIVGSGDKTIQKAKYQAL